MSAGHQHAEVSMSNRKHSLIAMGLGLAMLLCSGALQAGPVNINTADAATLAKELKGVGPKLAQAIVEYRQKHGPFKTADELSLVKGIGPAAIAKNRELIRTEGGSKESSKGAAEPSASLSGQR
jgi:competence protein ComEA